MDGYPGVCTTDNLDAARAWEPDGGPGHWNDLDMLTIGLTPATANPVVRQLAGLATGTPTASLDDTEARAEMSIWSMLASPLLAGNDLTRMTATTAAILTNAAVLAIDQDPLGAAPVRVPRADGLLLWTRPLADGNTAVLAVNRGDSPPTRRPSPGPSWPCRPPPPATVPPTCGRARSPPPPTARCP